MPTEQMQSVREAFAPDHSRNPLQYPPLVLAYVGDTVYDLYVRTKLVLNGDATPRNLHRQATELVRASAQAEAARRIAPLLSEQEQGIFRRGRNSHLGNVPKNAQVSDYRAATGLEALVGYLYLSGEQARLDELMAHILGNEEREED